MVNFEAFVLIGSILILASILIMRFSQNLGVPSFLLFLIVGLFAGAEGPLGIRFGDVSLAQSIGIMALIFILFAGGLDTQWITIRSIIVQGSILATVGVLVTAVIVAGAMVFLLGVSWLEGILFGAIVASTDAAAVFAVFRSKNIGLKGTLQPLLEFESGSNDPMAIFLALGALELIEHPAMSIWSMPVRFLLQMGIGGGVGYFGGRSVVWVLNRLRIDIEGLYPVFTLACATLIYGITTFLSGSGFLAVYVAGIVIGHHDFVHKKTMLRIFDGLAWMSQITMFMTLGLLVLPSSLLDVAPLGLIISAVLMFLARPAGVFFALIGSGMTVREKLFLAWVGIRGAVPIILATFPLLAGIPKAGLFFSLTFFIVFSSVVVQGWSVTLVAGWLKVFSPSHAHRRLPIEFATSRTKDTELVDFIVPYRSMVIGMPIVELGLPKDSLIVLISRNDRFVVPSGGTILEEGDTLLVLVTQANTADVRKILEQREI